MPHQQIVGLPLVVSADLTDTWYRGYEALSDAFTAMGLVKTADTGQVDWATATRPGTNNVSRFEIRRLDDAYQATDPVFLKIKYGYQTASTYYGPCIWIDVGTGSDGAGNLTGQPAGLNANDIAVGLNLHSGGASLTDWAIGSDGSGFGLLAGRSVDYRRWLLVERLRGNDGEPLPGQLIIARNGGLSYSDSGAFVQSWHVDLAHGYTDTLGVPVGYVDTLPSLASTLMKLGSNKYPFGILSVPTEFGPGTSKLMVGYAGGDLLHTMRFDLTRFSDNEVVPYYCHQPVRLPHSFGLVDNQSISNNPSTYGTPALYWG